MYAFLSATGFVYLTNARWKYRHRETRSRANTFRSFIVIVGALPPGVEFVSIIPDDGPGIIRASQTLLPTEPPSITYHVMDNAIFEESV